MARKVALYKIPEVLEEAEVLDGSVLEPYNESLKPLNERARQTLGKFGIINGELAGSSPFMQVQLPNSGALPEGERLAIRHDLETAITCDEEGAFLRGNYTEFGLALRTEGDSHKPNDSLARHLAGQLKAKGIKLGSGLLIPFSILENKESTDSDYGLIFNIPEAVLDLNPSQIREVVHDLGNYKWNCSRDEGLACAGLDSDRDWVSDYVHLDYSEYEGRVVRVSAVGARQKF